MMAASRAPAGCPWEFRISGRNPAGSMASNNRRFVACELLNDIVVISNPPGDGTMASNKNYVYVCIGETFSCGNTFHEKPELSRLSWARPAGVHGNQGKVTTFPTNRLIASERRQVTRSVLDRCRHIRIWIAGRKTPSVTSSFTGPR